MNNGYSDTLNSVLHVAYAYARENMNNAIEPAHLMKALLHKESGLVSFIEQELDQDYYYMLEWADMQIQLLPKTVKLYDEPEMSSESQSSLHEADQYRMRFDASQTEPLHLLTSLLTPGVGFSFEQLKTMPLTHNEIISKKNIPAISPEADFSVGDKHTKQGEARKSLLKYTVNLNKELEGRPYEVIGFEKELQRLFETLGRKNKSNVLLVGDSGVGKTALIEALVTRIVRNEVPVFLQDAPLYELDFSLLTSEANYKGEIEDRFKKIIDELSGANHTILVMEGIEKIFDKQSMLYGIAALLKKSLNKNEIKLLATASVEGYTKNIETDKEFIGKVEKIPVEEPPFDMAERILRGIKKHYEVHHQIRIPDEVAAEAIRLAKRYMAERSLPDSALDLIDKTLSHIRTMNNTSEKETAILREKLEKIKGEKESKINSEMAFELQWLHHEIFHRLSVLLTSRLDNQKDFSKLKDNDEKIKYLESIMGKLEELCVEMRTEVEMPDLLLVIAQQTGIPVGKVQTKERDKLINAENILKERVVGQDHAIRTVLEAIYESRSGLNRKGQPIASVFFLGPTGTGKTELTKALAEFLFQDESAIIRFDMSEFMESHSVATMTGAPAGYVGYEEGGLLVNKIRQKPYSIVLFDEIEKAHPDVFNIFLQIMDEGRIHDKLNRTGDFSNALIVFTSNVGSNHIFKAFERGIIPTSNELKQIMMERNFKPEFLGRLTEIIPFSPITKEIVMMIFDIHLKNLYGTLEDMNIVLEIPEETKEHLALSEFSPQLGARPILGIIRNQIRRPLSKLIISGEVKSNSHVTLKWNGSDYDWIYS